MWRRAIQGSLCQNVRVCPVVTCLEREIKRESNQCCFKLSISWITQQKISLQLFLSAQRSKPVVASSGEAISWVREWTELPRLYYYLGNLNYQTLPAKHGTCNSFSKLYQCHQKTKESFFLVFYFSYQPILFVCLLCIYLYIWKMCLLSFFSFCLITLITIFPNSKEYFSLDTNSQGWCKRSSWA